VSAPDPLSVCKANLAATEEALLDATDRIEQARALCREQILVWRAQKIGWTEIEKRACGRAFYGPLGGS